MGEDFGVIVAETPLIVELDEFFGAFLQREIKNLYPHFRVWEENF